MVNVIVDPATQGPSVVWVWFPSCPTKDCGFIRSVPLTLIPELAVMLYVVAPVAVNVALEVVVVGLEIVMPEAPLPYICLTDRVSV